MTRNRCASVLALCVILGACAGEEAPRAARPGADTAAGADTAPGAGAPAGAAPADTAPPAAEARPRVIEDTIFLEGMPEPMTMRLFQTPAGFPLPFGAYVPEDMAAEPAGGGGAAVRFVAEFGGRRNPDAFVHVRAYPEGTQVDEALAGARALIGTGGRTVEPLERSAPRGEWRLAEEGFRLRADDGSWLIGDIAVGRHGGRLFHVVLQYPEEYAEGLVPRAEAILESWVWTDTGERLTRE